MTRQSAEERLRRILAVVPWVASADGPAVSEVCERFEYPSEAALRADFELLFLCGVHPFTPDTLIEVDIDGGRVWVRYADWFARPLRLTRAEALTLVAASSALLGTDVADPDTPLARGLAKLVLALGIDPGDVDVTLGEAPGTTLAALNTAVAQHREVDIVYYSLGRDTRTERVIEPYVVYSAQGQWYVSAYCQRARAQRLFRVDRIESFALREATFPPPERLPAPPPVYEPRPADPRVVLDLAPEARWVVEAYETEQVDSLDGGHLRVRLAVSGEAWLTRLLLMLGPTACVVEGDDRAARAAAKRVRQRHGTS